MASLALGLIPDTLTVTLVTAADFVSALVPSTPWDDGAVIALVFDDPARTVWPATIESSGAAQWNVDKALVDDLVAALTETTPGVRLTYTVGALDLTWATGIVMVQR